MRQTPPRTAQEPSCRTSLPGTQQAAGAARRFLRAALARWAIPRLEDRVLDDATLLISELVTNAVVHAGTAVDVMCRLDAGLVLEISDRHPVRVLHQDRGDEGGRGLHLVAALSEEWGVTYRRDRKTVWCRIAVTETGADAVADDPLTPFSVRETPPAAAPAAASATGSPARTGERDGDVAALTPAAAPARTSAPALPAARTPTAPVPSPPPPAPRPEAEWISRGALTFLAEASDLLAGQLDEDKVASLAAQLLVPRLADWCAVWLHPAGAVPRLAHVWHSSEHLIDSLRALLEKAPPEPTLSPGARRTPWPVVADSARARDRGGALCVPLVTAGRSFGTLLMGRAGPPGPGGPSGRPNPLVPPGLAGPPGLPDEVIHLVEDFARRVALALSTARQYARQAMISTVLQRGLLPPATGSIPGVEHAVIYEPLAGDWVGGDFYDLFPAGDGRWCFALGDVCGNGPEAASLTGIARPVLRLLAREGCGVSDVLDRLNKALADEAATALIGETAAWEGGQARFLSLLYGEITPYAPGYGARCTLASAGHPLPLVLAPDGTVRPAAVPQMLLGISDHAGYTSESFDLAPGDTLLCVTDGVTERRRGRRQFDDDDGLAAALRGCTGLSAAGVAHRIRQAVHDYDTVPPDDDLALFVLQVVR